jgi:hypothetical protein
MQESESFIDKLSISLCEHAPYMKPGWAELFPKGVRYIAMVSSISRATALTDRHLYQTDSSLFGKTRGVNTYSLDQIESVRAITFMKDAQVEITLGGPRTMRAIAGSQFKEPKQKLAQIVDCTEVPDLWNPVKDLSHTTGVNEKFVDQVRTAIAMFGNAPVLAADPLDSIRKLKELLDLGAITQEEFDTKKGEYL